MIITIIIIIIEQFNRCTIKSSMWTNDMIITLTNVKAIWDLIQQTQAYDI